MLSKISMARLSRTSFPAWLKNSSTRSQAERTRSQRPSWTASCSNCVKSSTSRSETTGCFLNINQNSISNRIWRAIARLCHAVRHPRGGSDEHRLHCAETLFAVGQRSLRHESVALSLPKTRARLAHILSVPSRGEPYHAPDLLLDVPFIP